MWGPMNGIDYTEIVNARLHSALRNEAVWDKAVAAGVHLSMEPTAGELLRFVTVTGSDPVLLLGRIHDDLGGLDDFPRLDAKGVRN